MYCPALWHVMVLSDFGGDYVVDQRVVFYRLTYHSMREIQVGDPCRQRGAIHGVKA